MSDYISAVSAYKKILQANKAIKPTNAQNMQQATAILRKGDDMVALTQNKVAPQSFTNELQQAYITNPIKKVRSYSNAIMSPTRTDSQSPTSNVVELMENMDKLNQTVSSIVAVRDKILSAYMEIMKMPI